MNPKTDLIDRRRRDRTFANCTGGGLHARAGASGDRQDVAARFADAYAKARKTEVSPVLIGHSGADVERGSP